MRSGCVSSAAPPSWRFTVGAGAKVEINAWGAGEHRAFCAAWARFSASPPKNCTCTGQPTAGAHQRQAQVRF